MNHIAVLVVICIGIICLAFITKEEKSVQDKFIPPNYPAPDNLLEYPPANGEDHGDGLYSQILKKGTNNVPLRGHDIVHIRYKVWNSKGKNIDASDRKYHLLKYRVDGGGVAGQSRIIEGWPKLFPYLKEGETRRVWIPQHLAYGENAPEDLRGTLVFEMTVDKVERPITPPAFDEFPEQPDEDTKKFPSGLAALKTNKVEGKIVPKPDDNVVIHLDLWDSKGKLFRSTNAVDRQNQVSLAHIVPGMKEAIGMMKVGERYRFWIPAKLTYGDNPPLSFPKGDWICDIELVSISPPFDDVTTKHMEKKFHEE